MPHRRQWSVPTQRNSLRQPAPAFTATQFLLGFTTLLFGLILIMPILGHASWHAYRELVE